jgi:hypothetical protein
MPQPYSSWRIGIDLDNTLISYDHLFLEVAVARRLVPVSFIGSKREVRDYIRLLPDGENEWQRLQAHVYGPAIAGAVLAEGGLNFIHAARRLGVNLAIVSHKTAFSNMGSEKVNLRDAAREWLRANSVVASDAISAENVYFEDTRSDKIARIVTLRCTHFIDDLEEVFHDLTFPPEVEKLLLSTTAPVPAGPYRTYTSFREIADDLAIN